MAGREGEREIDREIHTTYVFIHRVRGRGMEGGKDNDRKKERL